jgi:hypothetical protein
MGQSAARLRGGKVTEMTQPANSVGPYSGMTQGVVSLTLPEDAEGLCALALRGEVIAGAEIVRRLFAGDPDLRRCVDDPTSDAAARLRTLLLRYLAHGTWQGLPLPADHHPAGHDIILRSLVSHAACERAMGGWRATLLRALRASDTELRRTAVVLLAECGQAGVLAAVVEVLGDPDEGVRWTAAIALARRDGPVAEVLLRRLAGGALEPELRHTAAYVLREIADAALRREVFPVVAALDRSDYRVAVPLAADAALRTLRPRDAGGKTAGGAS